MFYGRSSRGLSCETAITLRLVSGRSSVVSMYTMPGSFCPKSKIFQNIELLFHNRSVSLRTKINEKISAHTNDICERCDNPVRCFVMCIKRLKTTRIILRVTEFPVFVVCCNNRNALFRCRIIAMLVEPRIDDNIFFKFSQIGQSLWCFPFFGSMFPIAIKPN